MASPKRPTLQAEVIEEPMRLQADLLEIRISDDPVAAQIAFLALRRNPRLQPEDERELALKHGAKAVDDARSYRTIILSSLCRYLSFDEDTLAALDADPTYNAVLAGRRRHPEWTSQELEDNRVLVGAAELYHYAGAVLAYQTATGSEVSPPVIPKQSQPLDHAS